MLLVFKLSLLEGSEFLGVDKQHFIELLGGFLLVLSGLFLKDFNGGYHPLMLSDDLLAFKVLIDALEVSVHYVLYLAPL